MTPRTNQAYRAVPALYQTKPRRAGSIRNRAESCQLCAKPNRKTNIYFYEQISRKLSKFRERCVLWRGRRFQGWFLPFFHGSPVGEGHSSTFHSLLASAILSGTNIFKTAVERKMWLSRRAFVSAGFCADETMMMDAHSVCSSTTSQRLPCSKPTSTVNICWGADISSVLEVYSPTFKAMFNQYV